MTHSKIADVDYLGKPIFIEKEEDMRDKICGVCGTKTRIHKYDAYCSESCRSRAKNKAKVHSTRFW